MATEMNETKTWYRVSVRYELGRIEAREIDRDTAQFVFFTVDGWKGPEERREGKNTEDYRWLPSEAEAVLHARSLLTGRCDNLRARLDAAETALAAFNAAHPL